MGLIDFVREAGKKLLGRKPSPPGGPRGPAGTTSDVDRELAAELVKFVRQLGLEVQDLGIKVVDDVATVSGRAASQEVREKVVLAVGNVEGVARIDDRMTVERSEPEAAYYTVQKGDTLSAIAKRHYGDASKYPKIFEANRPMLSDPDKIYPGQVLRIPRQDG